VVKVHKVDQVCKVHPAQPVKKVNPVNEVQSVNEVHPFPDTDSFTPDILKTLYFQLAQATTKHFGTVTLYCTLKVTNGRTRKI
jgi:hypothetical protein